MNENENSSCALPHQFDNWETIVWRKVIQRVIRLQRRIAKAVKEGRWGKVKALMYLVTKLFYAKLLAVFRVTSNTFTQGLYPEKEWQKTTINYTMHARQGNASTVCNSSRSCSRDNSRPQLLWF
jgi:hypothetical protein